MDVFGVDMTPSAEEDLWRLFDFLVDQAQTLEDLEYAQRVLDELRSNIMTRLSENPWAYRKAGGGRKKTRQTGA